MKCLGGRRWCGAAALAACLLCLPACGEAQGDGQVLSSGNGLGGHLRDHVFTPDGRHIGLTWEGVYELEPGQTVWRKLADAGNNAWFMSPQGVIWCERWDDRVLAFDYDAEKEPWVVVENDATTCQGGRYVEPDLAYVCESERLMDGKTGSRVARTDRGELISISHEGAQACTALALQGEWVYYAWSHSGKQGTEGRVSIERKRVTATPEDEPEVLLAREAWLTDVDTPVIRDLFVDGDRVIAQVAPHGAAPSSGGCDGDVCAVFLMAKDGKAIELPAPAKAHYLRVVGDHYYYVVGDDGPYDATTGPQYIARRRFDAAEDEQVLAQGLNLARLPRVHDGYLYFLEARLREMRRVPLPAD